MLKTGNKELQTIRQIYQPAGKRRKYHELNARKKTKQKTVEEGEYIKKDENMEIFIIIKKYKNNNNENEKKKIRVGKNATINK